MLKEECLDNADSTLKLINQRDQCTSSISSVLGNSEIEILNHSLLIQDDCKDNLGKGASIYLRNISNADIGKIVFESTFLDINGVVIDICQSIIRDVLKQQKRLLNIEINNTTYPSVYSYHVQIKELVHTPIPAVNGNDKIVILKHSLRETDNDNPQIMMWSYIDISIRNISEETIATALFDAILYDSEGIVLDTIKHREYELTPNHSRMITIATNKVRSGTSKSYHVNLIKTISADCEKIQLKGHRINTTVDGEEINGTIKNISQYKSDAILVATFKNYKEEIIGIRVYSIRDIEPGAIRNFHFVFNPPEGEVVQKYCLEFAETIVDLK